MTKRTKKQIINIAFLVVLIGVTLTVLFVSQDINLNDIGNFLRGSKPAYIAAAFGGLVGFVLFEALSLHIIVRTLGHKAKFTSSLAYTTSDLYYSAITPSASGGQPASAYYMMRDGMSGGTTGFAVLFNIIAYTVATILVGLFGVVASPGLFGQIGHWFAQTLVIIGFVIQLLLLALLLLCLFRARVILKIGNGGITLLTKLHIVRKPDKWRTKLDGVVSKYRACRSGIKKHPMLFVNALCLNIAQRVSQTLIPCFVIMAVRPQTDFLTLFCMQSYVMIGYNSIPLPGGMGVYEYLYPNIFGIGGMFPDMTFVLSAMMVSRAISYYICMIVCGLYTLVYHAIGIKNIKEAPPDDVDLYSLPIDEAVQSLSTKTHRHGARAKSGTTVSEDKTEDIENIIEDTEKPCGDEDSAQPLTQENDDGSNGNE